MRQRSDLLIVCLLSLLSIAYLIAEPGLGEPRVQGAEIVSPATPPAPLKNAPPRAATTPNFRTPWRKNHGHVPSELLYDLDDPAPEFAVKKQSWHNRLMFPSVVCPYCGRRVPTKDSSYLWLLVGFVGQVAFSARFVVQWIASERAKASVIPVSFWWLSIIGSLILLAYAISIPAWPIILGQAPGCLIYGRNLFLLKNTREDAAAKESNSESR